MIFKCQGGALPGTASDSRFSIPKTQQSSCEEEPQALPQPFCREQRALNSLSPLPSQPAEQDLCKESTEVITESFKEHSQPGLPQPQLEARLVSAGKDAVVGESILLPLLLWI